MAAPARPLDPGPGPPRRARDFYSKLIEGSQAKAVGVLAERERWLRSVRVEGREELLFEFEMLLRGVERYFNLHNATRSTARFRSRASCSTRAAIRR
jgi:hypothetical protein